MEQEREHFCLKNLGGVQIGQLWGEQSDAGLVQPGILSEAFSPQQVVHEIRNYPYPQLHFLALQGLNPSRHTSAVRESYEVRPPLCLAPAGLVETPFLFIVPSSFLLLVAGAWEVAGSFGVESKREKKRE